MNNPADSNSISDNWIYSITEDNDGNIWIGTRNGLNKYNQKTGYFKQFLHTFSDTSSISSNYIYGLSLDKQGNILANTLSALNIINPKTFTVNKFVNPYVISNEISDEGRPVLQTHEGNIWIATTEGLWYFDPIKEHFHISDTFSKPNSLTNNDIRALIEDSKDNLWIGSQNGLNRMNLKSFAVSGYYLESKKIDSTNTNFIRSIREDRNGKLWIGTNGGGLNILDRFTNKVEHYTSQSQGNSYISNNFVHEIYEDGKNRIWIGTRDKINIFDKVKKRFLPISQFFASDKLPDFQNIRVNDILEDSFGFFLIATQNGLYKLDIENQKFDIFLQGVGNNNVSSNLVYRVIEDSSHNIWIGTTSGLNKFVTNDSVFLYFSKNNGLSSNIIYEIQEDKNKNLWFATVEGLCVYYSKENVFRAFEIEDGMQGREFNRYMSEN